MTDVCFSFLTYLKRMDAAYLYEVAPLFETSIHPPAIREGPRDFQL